MNAEHQQQSQESGVAEREQQTLPLDRFDSFSEGVLASGPSNDPPPRHESAAERGLTTPRAAGVAGIIFAVLFILALALLSRVVGVSLETEQVMENLYGSSSTPALVGLYMVPFAGIAFIWFIGVIRDRIGEREDRFFATVFLGSGLLFVAMLFAGAAVLGGLIAGNRFGIAAPTNIETVGFARSVGYSFLFVYSAKVAGVFMLATSTIVRRSRWPRWTYLSGFIGAAVLILSVSFFEPTVLLLPAWVAAISCYVLVTGGRRSSTGQSSEGNQAPATEA